MTQKLYAVGTVSVVAGSRNFAGIGTAWNLALVEGGLLVIEGSTVGAWPIEAISSDTEGTFKFAWPGASLTGATYAIYLEYAQAADAIEANRLLREIVYRLYAGTFLAPDATGTLAERAAHDGEVQGFIYIQTDVTPFRVFIKRSATSGDWSAYTELQGPEGDEGAPGTDGIGDAYDITSGRLLGRPASDETFDLGISARPVTFPANLAGSIARASAAATGTAVFSIRKNGVEVGTVTFDGSSTGAFSSSGFALAAGDLVSIVAPTTQDATLAGLIFTLAGARAD